MSLPAPTDGDSAGDLITMFLRRVLRAKGRVLRPPKGPVAPTVCKHVLRLSGREDNFIQPQESIMISSLNPPGVHVSGSGVWATWEHGDGPVIPPQGANGTCRALIRMPTHIDEKSYLVGTSHPSHRFS